MKCGVQRLGLVWLIFYHGLSSSVYGNFTKLPYELMIATDCLGVSATPNEHHITLNCSSNEQIAVDYIQYSFQKNTSTQCYEDFESNSFGECCSINNTDCFVYNNGIASNCSGNDNCNINTKQLESTDYPHCNNHLNVSSFIEVAYYCVSSDVAIINLADSADEKTSSHVHLQSFMYPEPNVNLSTSCSVETACDVSLTATIIESNIKCHNGSARIYQNNSDLVLCNGAANHSLIRILHYPDQHFLYFTLQEFGRLWIMFSASDSVSNVTVTCGSDAQYNATSICPNITSSGYSSASPGSTGPPLTATSSSATTGSSEITSSFMSLTQSSSSMSVTESSSSMSVTESSSSMSVTESSSSMSVTESSSFVSVTESASSALSSSVSEIESSTSSSMSVTELLSTSVSKTESSTSAQGLSTDKSMVIGVVSGTIVLISAIFIGAVLIRIKGKKKVSEKQNQDHTKIQAWV